MCLPLLVLAFSCPFWFFELQCPLLLFVLFVAFCCFAAFHCFSLPVVALSGFSNSLLLISTTFHRSRIGANEWKCEWKMLFVARFGFWFVFPFAVRCLLLLFVALSCFYLKNQNRQMPFVARYGFLLLVLVFCGCFHLSIALLVVAFCWYEKPKRATKGKKSPNGNQA